MADGDSSGVGGNAGVPAFSSHPLAEYLSNLDDVIRALVVERERLLNLSNDLSKPQSVRDQAAVDAAAIESRINLLTAQRNAFVVGLVTATQGPSQALVDTSKTMASKLAQVVVDANRPAALLKIVDNFLAAATQVLTGSVPAVAAPAAGGTP